MRLLVTTATGSLALALAGCGQQPATKPADLGVATPPTVSASASPSGALSPPAGATPPPSARATATPPRRHSIRDTDWHNVTLTRVPTSVCGGGTLRFHGGTMTAGTDPDRSTTWDLLVFDERPAYGDIDGDGIEDAVLTLGCYTGRPDHPTIYLVAVHADGSARRAFGAAGGEPHFSTIRPYRVQDRTIVAVVRDGYRETVTTKRYRWNGSAFE